MKATLPELLQQRILVLDGAMGTMIQRHKFQEMITMASGSKNTATRFLATTTFWSSHSPKSSTPSTATFLKPGPTLLK